MSWQEHSVYALACLRAAVALESATGVRQSGLRAMARTHWRYACLKQWERA